jgi:hypothetical protein
VLTGVAVMAGGAQGFGGYALDLYEYQCYAVAFWRGAAGLGALPATQCYLMQSIAGVQPDLPPLHLLPREYGALALAVFSPPLLAPEDWYPWLFTGEMVLALLATAALCARWGPRLAGHAYLLYVLAGNAIIAGTRFDVAPALLTVLAMIWSGRGQRWQAYAALAAATLLKAYPVVFLLPLLVADVRANRRGAASTVDAHQRGTVDAGWRAAFRGLAVYTGVLALGLGLALQLSPSEALGPLSFLAGRGVEFESLPATLLLIAHLAGGVPFSIGYEANVTVVLAPVASVASTAALALGLALAGVGVWLQWRGRLTLGRACLVVLLGTLVASKVFSPQYLLWAAPLVALEFGLDVVWSVVWGGVCVLTALAFPAAYDGSLAWPGVPAWQLVVWLSGLRNVALVLAAAGILWQAAVGPRPITDSRGEAPERLATTSDSTAGLRSLAEAP